MSKVFDFSGGTDFFPGGFLYANRKDSKFGLSLGRHVDVYFPRKRSRVSAPFPFVSEEKQQSSIDVLPDECLFEVFRRLSGGQERSICACVSKRWLMLLSSIRRNEMCPSKTTNDHGEDDKQSISQKVEEATLPKEKDDFVDSVDRKSEDVDEYQATDLDGFLSRCLEGKNATDVRLASIAIGTGKFGGLGKLSIRGDSSMSGLTNMGLKAIARSCPSLRTLSLWNLSSIGDEALCEIASEANLLEKLDLCHCPTVTDKGLIAIAMNCSRLTSVSLESCLNIGNESLQALGRYCPNLKFVTVKNCPLVGDKGITSLFMSTGHVLAKAKFQGLAISDVSLAVVGHYGMALNDLELINLQNVNDRGFWVMGRGLGLQKLKVLSVTGCRGISDSGLEALGVGFPNLKFFGLKKCLLVSDTGVVRFAKAAVSLESLQFVECHKITKSGAVGILANCGGSMKALTFDNCLGIRDVNFALHVKPICNSLQSLTVRHCPGFGDVSLGILCGMCPQLSRVDFSGLRGITDAGIIPLIQSLESGLKKINLSGCVNLTDNTVVAISKLHGETLEVLNVDGCKFFTDVSLLAISVNCSMLDDLDVSSSGVSDAGLAALAGAEQLNLRVFSVAKCPSVSEKSVPFLGSLGKTLVGLNIQHCKGISTRSVDLLLEKLSRCNVLF